MAQNSKKTEQNKSASATTAKSKGRGTKNTQKSNNSTKNNSKQGAAKNSKPSTAENKDSKQKIKEISPYTNEIVGVSFCGIGAILIVFLFSNSESKNLATYISAFFSHLFGFGSIILPFLLIAVGIIIFANKGRNINKVKAWASGVLFLSSLAIVHIIACENGTVYDSLAAFIRNFYLNGDTGNGGLIGALIGGALVLLIGKIAACIVCIVIIVIAFILISDISIFSIIKNLKAMLDYRNDDYYDDDFDDDEPQTPKKVVREKAKPEKYDDDIDLEKVIPPSRLEKNRNAAREEINRRRNEGTTLRRPVKHRYTPDVPDENSPYLTDNSGRVLAFDLKPNTDRNRQSISIFTGDREQKAEIPQPLVNKPTYDPNNAESDVNTLFINDNENEYDELLQEATELFNEPVDNIYEGNIDEKPVESSTQPAVADEKPIAPEYDENDIPPWEESSRPQIIKAEQTRELDSLNVEHSETYKFPKLEFLGINRSADKQQSEAEMIAKGEHLRKTLLTFHVEARVDNICTGPTVTRYELIPKEGTRVQTITKLEQDIALALAAETVRIEAPIPGKSAIGIEIPNETVQSVYYSEVLRNEKFQNFKSKIAFGIGKDIAGNVVVYDIAKTPHMLIAGATGAGKSVCINTLITSILYKATPEEVRLIMVDPKVVELSVYNGIPHLLIPVVTDPKKASGALNWAVGEMMRRYDLFATTGTRNLEGYNKREETVEKLPQIVIIIDELADLMMVARKEVEDSICRLAQLARAAGIHLIIATQRPSADVITGLIKANIPSRIAFKVSSGTDSRVVIDSVGAEKLLGRGDMLFKAVDMNKALRVQGAFVTDEEVARIVDYIKTDVPNYDTSVMEQIEKAEQESNAAESDIQTNDSDELIDQVIDFIVHTKKASASALQRKFRIGFGRAGRIIDELEERGIVGPENGSKPREVLMSPYERSEYKERHNNY